MVVLQVGDRLSWGNYISLMSPFSSQKMGKKSRVKTQKSGTGAAASVSPKETLTLTSELLQSEPCPGLGGRGTPPQVPPPRASL